MTARMDLGYPVRIKYSPGVWQISKIEDEFTTVWSSGVSKRLPTALVTPVKVRHPVFASAPVIRFGVPGNPEVTGLVGSLVEFPRDPAR